MPNVPAPYTATVLDSGARLAIQYRGLTRTDPTLFALFIGTPPRTATLSGQLSGPAVPLPSFNYRATVEFVSPETGLFNSPLMAVPAGDFSGSVRWSGPSTTSGTLYALEIHNDAGLPMDYPGYGTSSNVQLQDMSPLSGQNLALGPVTTSTLSGVVTAPAGFTLAGRELFFQPAPDAVFTIVDEQSADAGFSYTTPNVSNATFTLVVTTQGPSSQASTLKKAGLAANATGLALTIPAPPTLSLPVNSATGVTVTTPFSWTNFTGVYLLIFSGSGPTYAVFTAATTTTIPDLSSQGLPLPASATYSWEAYGFGPATTTDSLAVPGGLLNLLFLQDGYACLSEHRAFTTSP